ncbi:right-handed parallel beta-helix repeat-containing protein [bacterium]|nr:right-handed parallel beta-helix repeat-containing protein [bacterium]
MKTVFTISILICMMLIASIAWSMIIYVDDDAPPGGDGSEEYPFQYIQEGIDAAEIGDTVSVAEGKYEENIDLKSGVEVIGAGADVTTITASSGYVVTADNIGSEVVISGFTIDGQWTSSRGISCVRNSSPTINDNIITHSAYGILCTDSSPVIMNNTITYLLEHALRCEASRPIICDNVISHVGIDAIWFGHGSAAITNNKIIDVGGAGIKCWGTGGAFIEDNEITESTIGIECRDKSRPIIRRNVIRENFLYGIAVYSLSRPDIGTEVEPGLNEIFNNGDYNIYSENSAEIKAELNWWGQIIPHPDYFYGNIDYKPWLKEPVHPPSIGGHVSNCKTGEPVDSALVIAIRKAEKVKTFTDKDSYYDIYDLEPGFWLLICIKKGYELHIAKVDVKAGECTMHVFCLEPK